MTTAINLIAAGASGRRAVANGSDKACPGRNAPSPASFIWVLPIVVTPHSVSLTCKPGQYFNGLDTDLGHPFSIIYEKGLSCRTIFPK